VRPPGKEEELFTSRSRILKKAFFERERRMLFGQWRQRRDGTAYTLCRHEAPPFLSLPPFPAAAPCRCIIFAFFV
jgi:hypothetical protein